MDEWIPTRRDFIVGLVQAAVPAIVTFSLAVARGVPWWVVSLATTATFTTALWGVAAWMFIRTNRTRPRNEDELRRTLVMWLVEQGHTVEMIGDGPAGGFTIGATDLRSGRTEIEKLPRKNAIEFRVVWDANEEQVDAIESQSGLEAVVLTSSIVLELVRTNARHSLRVAGGGERGFAGSELGAR